MGSNIREPQVFRAVEQDAEDVELTFYSSNDVIYLSTGRGGIHIDGNQLISIMETLVMKGCIDPPKQWRWEA